MSWTESTPPCGQAASSPGASPRLQQQATGLAGLHCEAPLYAAGWCRRRRPNAQFRYKLWLLLSTSECPWRIHLKFTQAAPGCCSSCSGCDRCASLSPTRQTKASGTFSDACSRLQKGSRGCVRRRLLGAGGEVASSARETGSTGTNRLCFLYCHKRATCVVIGPTHALTEVQQSAGGVAQNRRTAASRSTLDSGGALAASGSAGGNSLARLRCRLLRPLPVKVRHAELCPLPHCSGLGSNGVSQAAADGRGGALSSNATPRACGAPARAPGGPPAGSIPSSLSSWSTCALEGSGETPWPLLCAQPMLPGLQPARCGGEATGNMKAVWEANKRRVGEGTSAARDMEKPGGKAAQIFGAARVEIWNSCKGRERKEK